MKESECGSGHFCEMTYKEKVLSFYPGSEELVGKAAISREHLTHAAMGLSGESGELTDLIKKHVIYGRPLDKAELILEMGDVLNYLTFLSAVIDVPLHEIRRKNIEKIEARVKKNSSYFKGGTL